MSRLLRLVVWLPLFALVARAAEPVLRIVGLEKTLTLTTEEFAALPHAELKVLEPHEKKERTYSGVAVRELLAKVGAPSGEKVRGRALSLGVLVRSKDGYAVLFALAEFDENFSSRTLLLADREDGQPPPATAAPLRLVAPGDKRGARWARMVTSIEIVAVGAKP
jgi:DMSO/TMAO reductase YedYZ molybdopterin-dependent catalytic subunit